MTERLNGTLPIIKHSPYPPSLAAMHAYLRDSGFCFGSEAMMKNRFPLSG